MGPELSGVTGFPIPIISLELLSGHDNPFTVEGFQKVNADAALMTLNRTSLDNSNVFINSLRDELHVALGERTLTRHNKNNS